MQRRDVSFALLGTAAALGMPQRAHAAITEGREYTRLQQPLALAAAPGKFEVLEFFAYWCPHCNALEPELEAWARKLPADVQLRRMPVAFRANEELLQQLYFAIESLGLVAALHRKVFEAIHVQHAPFNSMGDVAAFAKASGTDSSRLVEAMKSFSVATRVRQARALAEAARLDGVPTLVVQGRYVTSVGNAGGQTQMFAVLDALIAMARKSKG